VIVSAIQQTQTRCQHDGLDARGGVELSFELFDMEIHCFVRDGQDFSDLPIRLAAQDPEDDFLFAQREFGAVGGVKWC
jgi:hypothetical protein